MHNIVNNINNCRGAIFFTKKNIYTAPDHPLYTSVFSKHTLNIQIHTIQI